MALASRYDDGDESLILISNRSFILSPLNALLLWYSRMLNESALVSVLWRIIPPTVVEKVGGATRVI